MMIEEVGGGQLVEPLRDPGGASTGKVFVSGQGPGEEGTLSTKTDGEVNSLKPRTPTPHGVKRAN